MTGPTSSVRAAAALLTRLPLATSTTTTAGAAAFPVVGLAIGGLAAVPLLVLGPLEPVIAAIAALAVVAIVSGGLHLDGLADTTDALMAPDPERAELARRDPRIGSGGVIALILVVGAEVAAIVSLFGSRPSPAVAGVVVVAMTASRLMPIVAARLERPAAGDGSAGFGPWFARQVSRVDVVVATTVTVGVAAGASLVVGSWLPTVAGAAGLLLGAIATVAVRHARGRLDGDGLGASVELTVVLSLVAAAIGG